MNDCFDGEHIIAIDNVLREFEETQAEVKSKKEIDEIINKIKSKLENKDKELETYKKIIENAKTYLEYYLIGNTRYDNATKEFKKILIMLGGE